MPPRKKTDEADAAVKPPRPAHLSELCSECGQYEVHPDYKAWSCEHGSWNFADFAPMGVVARAKWFHKAKLQGLPVGSPERAVLEQEIARLDGVVEEPGAEPVSEEDARAALLAGLDVETLTALLAEKTAAETAK